MCREFARQIQNELSLVKQTVTDWSMFCRETMLVFLEVCSEKIGGLNQTVETDAASSVGASTIEGTLYRVSGCLAVLNEGPADCSLFTYRTEPPKHWRPSKVTGLNTARRSSVIAVVRIAISNRWDTRTVLSTTTYTSFILNPNTKTIWLTKQPYRWRVLSILY